jgi:hypothetical protein
VLAEHVILHDELAEEVRFLRAHCEEQLEALMAAEKDAGQVKTTEVRAWVGSDRLRDLCFDELFMSRQANLKASLAAAERRAQELQSLLDDAEAALLGQEAEASEELRVQVEELEEELAAMQAERDQALARSKELEGELEGFEQQLNEDTTIFAEQEEKIQVGDWKPAVAPLVPLKPPRHPHRPCSRRWRSFAWLPRRLRGRRQRPRRKPRMPRGRWRRHAHRRSLSRATRPWWRSGRSCVCVSRSWSRSCRAPGASPS